ncbi:hypothetical protein POM88_045302 [Heracleum sosnowskyi]|uniref:Uncharacterized protein n=1 Tax=Heracleum sosnowskyi TaxID=360622 RepID=A0AAD8M6A4_9APIA|nr:hypothetical protein POM88_045302 [Heracleum sosnowskyi]
MDKVEDFMKKFDEDPNHKNTDSVAEGEVFVGGVAEEDGNIVASKVAECAEKVEPEKVAREIYKDNVPDEPMDELQDAFAKSMDVEMKDVGVHWLLAILDFHGREIRVRNTLSCEGIKLIVKKALLPLCMLLPHYFLLTEFCSRTDIDFSAVCYTEKSKTNFFRLVMQKDFSSGTSIGMIMMSIDEYFVMEKDFPKTSFDIPSQRSRIAYLFYMYGVLKQIHGYESEAEYFDHDDGHDPGKKTRGGIAQTRK